MHWPSSSSLKKPSSSETALACVDPRCDPRSSVSSESVAPFEAWPPASSAVMVPIAEEVKRVDLQPEGC